MRYTYMWPCHLLVFVFDGEKMWEALHLLLLALPTRKTMCLGSLLGRWFCAGSADTQMVHQLLLNIWPSANTKTNKTKKNNRSITVKARSKSFDESMFIHSWVKQNTPLNPKWNCCEEGWKSQCRLSPVLFRPDNSKICFDPFKAIVFQMQSLN